jgi:hypothetical protein
LGHSFLLGIQVNVKQPILKSAASEASVTRDMTTG